MPVVANPPLARALYRVEVDADIPAEHYQAVAEIIAYVWRLARRHARTRREVASTQSALRRLAMSVKESVLVGVMGSSCPGTLCKHSLDDTPAGMVAILLAC